MIMLSQSGVFNGTAWSATHNGGRNFTLKVGHLERSYECNYEPIFGIDVSDYADMNAIKCSLKLKANETNISQGVEEMIDLTMRSEEVRVTKILKKTQAKMFKNIEVGDVLQLSVEAEPVGRGSRGSTYAAYVRVDNLTKKEHAYKSFNTLSVLDNFELAYE